MKIYVIQSFGDRVAQDEPMGSIQTQAFTRLDHAQRQLIESAFDAAERVGAKVDDVFDLDGEVIQVTVTMPDGEIYDVYSIHELEVK